MQSNVINYITKCYTYVIPKLVDMICFQTIQLYNSVILWWISESQIWGKYRKLKQLRIKTTVGPAATPRGRDVARGLLIEYAWSTVLGVIDTASRYLRTTVAVYVKAYNLLGDWPAGGNINIPLIKLPLGRKELVFMAMHNSGQSPHENKQRFINMR
jgi:hypothetical protein